MSTTVLVLLVSAAAIVVFVLAAILVMKLQKMTVEHDQARPASPSGDPAPTGFQQAPSETREAYVRRHWQRPGVIANGPTLVDLYDRIGELERRLAETERQLKSQS
ncbi:MAG: hypothetical protein QOH68_2277 [Nocardioidaceae bacterium]|nr:hypothetical protein [Nocardioidaceae bacterium]